MTTTSRRPVPSFTSTLTSAHEIATRLHEMRLKAEALTHRELAVALAEEEHRLAVNGEHVSKYDILWSNVLRAEIRKRLTP